MKLLDFGVGGGRIVVAKRLIYSQFSTNKILPQKLILIHYKRCLMPKKVIPSNVIVLKITLKLSNNV